MSRSPRPIECPSVKVDGAQFRCDGQLYAYLVVEGAKSPLAELTRAEQEVVELVASGCSNREVAERRRVSVNTVGNQLAAIFGKLGVSSRHELVARLSRGEPTGP